MVCPGIVTNVTNFGAFVDIGVHQDGLVHISQLCRQVREGPARGRQPGRPGQVKVLAVNLDKKQISLTMKSGSASESRGERPAAARARRTTAAGRRAIAARRHRRRRPSPPPFNNPFAAALANRGKRS